MHMADALISPTVGATFWAATAGTIAYCSRKVRLEQNDRVTAYMGVLGAFIFSAQMINFAIPGTGSSGHIGGGLLLAILLGPHAAFLVMSSVLFVQALFFADGGLLALGCNIFNLAFFPCFIAYPLIYAKLVQPESGRWRIITGTLTAAVIGLQLGSLGVVMQTVASGVAELPFKTFLLVMQPIHLAIGLIEGFATAAVILFISNARPEMIFSVNSRPYSSGKISKGMITGFLVLTLVTGGALAWLASTSPDGLERSIDHVAGSEEITGMESTVHSNLEAAQQHMALLPDYNFRNVDGNGSRAGTSLSGLTGGAVTLVLTAIVGLLLRRRRSPG